MKNLIIFCLIVCAGVATQAKVTGDEKQRIQGLLDEAIDDFKLSAQEARKQLLASLKADADRAQRAGDLQKLADIQRETSAFDEFGIVPTVVSTSSFDRRMKAARERLDTSHESAVEDFTRLGTIDAAKKVQRDLLAIHQHGIVPLLEIGLLHDHFNVWKPNNDSIAHWSIQNDILKFDGTQGEKATLFTRKSFRNFSLRCEWRIGPGGDSGILLRGVPQVQIWDHTRGNGKGIGSGGLYNNRSAPNAPTQIADKPIGQWNKMTVTLIDDAATVTLNGQRVTIATKMENHPRHKSPLPVEGPIGLQAFRSPIEFRNLTVLQLP